MKTIRLYILAVVTFLLFFAGCIANITVDESPILPQEPSMIKLISLAVLSIYEVVVRAIPSVNDYSLVSWIIKALKKVSDTLNRGH